MKKEIFSLCDEQLNALNYLNSGENVFLTGGAGSGKSFLIKEFIKLNKDQKIPILASTGAAAVLVGGRTFHSFFSLGIMEGGREKTIEKATKDSKLKKRLNEVDGIIIDEISMISGEILSAAEEIARIVRNKKSPFGGLRVLAVGDFAQLPPVTKTGTKDWCFKHPVWEKIGFHKVILNSNHRVEDSDYLNVLNSIREGIVTPQVTDFLNHKTIVHDESAKGIRLFPFRNQADAFNFKRLAQITAEEILIPTVFWGDQKHVDRLKNSSAIPIEIKIKVGAEIIFTQNDPQKRWINGTQGIIKKIADQKLIIEKRNLREVTVEKSTFDFQNADGEIIASAVQFPITLGYATTIHKSQGATLDELWCDLGHLWEPGHAYVALSRLKHSSGLKLIKWNPSSIKADKDVLAFYR